MPRTEIPVTESSRGGVAPPAATNADMTNGMFIAANNGRIWLQIVSSDGATQTVGFAIPGDVDGVAIDDKVVSIPAGTTKDGVGPWLTGTYNQEDDELHINPSVGGATLKFRAYRLSND